MRKLLFTLLLALGAGAALAQDTSFARTVICELASSEMHGRGMQLHGDSIAADYLRRQLVGLGARPLPGTNNYFQHFRFPNTRRRPPIVDAGYRSQNVCAYLPGETDTMLVFTAHYDHLGMSGDTVFTGAHDNASGVAALLDLVRLAQERRSRYTLVFLFFGGEEAGLVGSAYFADVPLLRWNRVKLLVNLDLFCGGDEGLMVVNANAPETAPFVDLLDDINERFALVPKLGRRDNAPNSDHFHLSRFCPAIFIYTLGGPYGGYHSPDDTCEGCGLQHYDAHLRLLRLLMERLDA